MDASKQRVLLVEDSIECQMVVEKALAQSPVELVKASSLAEARRILAAQTRANFHLILLDLLLPDGDGLSLLDGQSPEKFSEETPVFLLTSKGELESKLIAFESGVDDYLVKPVSPGELKARVDSRLKKVRHYRQANSSLLHRGPLTLYVPQMKATIRNGAKETDVGLTGKEFKILYFLIRHEGDALTRADLIKEAWGEGIHVLERTVDSHVAGLRRKLGAASAFVHSVPGEGYRFATQEGKSPTI